MMVTDRMSNYGLSKLTEEMGEAGQVIGKMLQFPELMIDRDHGHPDGGGHLPGRLEDELADVMAAIKFVIVKMALNIHHIEGRADRKFELFAEWDKGDREALLPGT